MGDTHWSPTGRREPPAERSRVLFRQEGGSLQGDDSRQALPKVGVAVFAYNEERLIGGALDRFEAMRDEAVLEVHVLVNGCTDRTEDIVRARAATRPWIHPVVIARGDKANAWNTYVHETAPLDAAVHVFTDGDVRIRPGAIAALVRRLAEVPHANACAGVPGSGRSAEALRRRIVEDGEMYGNLYALRGSFVAELRRRGVRLPFGMFGEDGLVTALVWCDLDPRKPFDRSRVTAAEDAVYEFDALSPWRLGDWRIYRNRKRRYALRLRQGEMLWSLLQEHGLNAMPAHVVDLYLLKGAELKPRGRGLNRLFDWEARRWIRKAIAAAEAAKAREAAHLFS